MDVPRTLVVCLVVGAGCASATSMQTADTIGRKKLQLSVQQSYQTQVNRDSAQGYPMEGIAVRYGVTDRLDVGGALGPEGLEVASKFRLTQPSSPVTLSVAPSLAGTGDLADGLLLLVYQADLALLGGVSLPRDCELVVGSRVHELFIGGGTDPSLSTGLSTPAGTATTYAGASAGVAFHGLGGKVLPELGFLYPVATVSHRYDGLGGVSWFAGKTVVQATVSFLWGGR